MEYNDRGKTPMQASLAKQNFVFFVEKMTEVKLQCKHLSQNRDMWSDSGTQTHGHIRTNS